MKRCFGCKLTKPLQAFGRNAARRDGVQTLCKDCRPEYMRQHYIRNLGKYRARAIARNRQRRQFVRRIIESAKDRPCADCGGRYPSYVMDFDHRDPNQKLFNIGKDAPHRMSEEQLRNEIAKCDVVCANCNRARTYRPRG